MASTKPNRDPAEEIPQADSPKSLTPIIRFSIVLAFAGFVVFVSSVRLFAAYGGPWVDGLDDQIGEIVRGRAKDLASAGHVDEAVDMYASALALRFDDPQQRDWATDELIGLLAAKGRWTQLADFGGAVR